jgi:hypothetical protein
MKLVSNYLVSVGVLIIIINQHSVYQLIRVVWKTTFSDEILFFNHYPAGCHKPLFKAQSLK